MPSGYLTKTFNVGFKHWVIAFLTLLICSVASASGWQPRPLYGDIPSPRYDYSMVRVGDEFYIYGGRGPAENGNKANTKIYGDFFVYDTATGLISAITAVTPPPPLYGHTAVASGNGFYVFGGVADKNGHRELNNYMWYYNRTNKTFQFTNTQGPRPPARLYSAAINSVTSTGFTLFGGATISDITSQSMTSLRDVWYYNPQTMRYTQQPDMPFPGRYGHALVQDITSTFVIGGRNEYGVQYPVWEYNRKQKTWYHPDFVNNPPPASNMVQISSVTQTIASRYYRIGGYGYPSSPKKGVSLKFDEMVLGEVWQLDLATRTWQRLADIPPISNACGAVLPTSDPSDPEYIVLLGGLDENQVPTNQSILVYTTVEEPTPLPTLTPTTGGVTETNTPTATHTQSVTMTPTQEVIPTETATTSPTVTATLTSLPSSTATRTETSTLTPTGVHTTTPTITATASMAISPTPSATPTLIPGDINQDRKVNVEDLLILLQNWNEGE